MSFDSHISLAPWERAGVRAIPFDPFDLREMGRKRSGQPRSVRHTVAGRFGRHLEQLAAAAGLTTAEFAKLA
jgi:hypothetical protein